MPKSWDSMFCGNKAITKVLIEHLHAAERRARRHYQSGRFWSYECCSSRRSLALERPIIEVHLTNPSKREEFRQRSLTADVAIGQINGLERMVIILP